MRKQLIIFVIALVLIIAGCKQENGQVGAPSTPFVGGQVGLLMNFVEGAPPKEVFDGGDFPFDVEVDLKNIGESFISKNDATVKISGIDPAEFGKSASDFVKHPDDDLEPTQRDPDGALIESPDTFVTFSDLNHVSRLAGNTPFTVRADVCYKYTTKTQAKLCIKEDLLDTSDTDVCVVSEDKTAYNSGAPVGITSFREQASGKDKVAFIFNIQALGGGDVFRYGTVCDDSTRANENKVYVSVDTGISGLSCSGLSDGTATSGYVTLNGGKRAVRCTQMLNERTDYEKPINIELTYDYNEFITTDLLVKHTSS